MLFPVDVEDWTETTSLYNSSIASLAKWLRLPPLERKILDSIPGFALIFPNRVMQVTLKWHSSGYPARRLEL